MGNRGQGLPTTSFINCDVVPGTIIKHVFMSSKFNLIDTVFSCGLNKLLFPRTGAPTFSSLYNYYDSNKHSAGYLYPPLNDVLSSWKHFNLSSDTLNYRNNRAKSPMVTRELNRSDVFKTKDLIMSHSSL